MHIHAKYFEINIDLILHKIAYSFEFSELLKCY